jgi:hypothetical protein
MSENYIVLNGKCIDLTDDQLEKLGLKVEKKDCFTRVPNQKYYTIMGDGLAEYTIDSGNKLADTFDTHRHKVANYCTDKKLMEQRALHETLSRLLWRFSMQNDGDKIDWKDGISDKYFIYFDHERDYFDIDTCCIFQYTECPYFNTKEIAKRAIDEIVLPFMKEHPEFVW